ncbi:MAG TPA: hypothetical protein VGV35_16120 [Bryobacteraceae bacterium]|nr:hypothetical protein [Bryobacteraceae bacterium]
MKRLHAAMTTACVEYRIVGGMGVFLQVSERDPNAARFTRDVDISVSRKDLQRITEIASEFGFRYRHAANVDMLVDAEQRIARSAVHLLFTGEKVRPHYLEPVPGFSPATITQEGFPLAPVADLVRMKLTSFRLKDKVHLLDMDGVGLITPEIEAALTEPLRARLQQVREEERQSPSDT